MTCRGACCTIIKRLFWAHCDDAGDCSLGEVTFAEYVRKLSIFCGKAAAPLCGGRDAIGIPKIDVLFIFGGWAAACTATGGARGMKFPAK